MNADRMVGHLHASLELIACDLEQGRVDEARDRVIRALEHYRKKGGVLRSAYLEGLIEKGALR